MKNLIIGISVVSILAFGTVAFAQGMGGWGSGHMGSGNQGQGDRNDPNSEVSKLLKQYKPMKLKNNKGEFLKEGEDGTKPNVFYIRSFKPGVEIA